MASPPSIHHHHLLNLQSNYRPVTQTVLSWRFTPEPPDYLCDCAAQLRLGAKRCEGGFTVWTGVVLSGAPAGINWALSVLESWRYKAQPWGADLRTGLHANCFFFFWLKRSLQDKSFLLADFPGGSSVPWSNWSSKTFHLKDLGQ